MTEFVEMIELKGEGHTWVRKDAYVKLEQQIKELIQERDKARADANLFDLKTVELGRQIKDLEEVIYKAITDIDSAEYGEGVKFNLPFILAELKQALKK